MIDTISKAPGAVERRRDQRIVVCLPFLLEHKKDSLKFACETVNISPTGMLLECGENAVPEVGTIVDITIQGTAEVGWEHLNSRAMRIVRIVDHQIGLTYVDLESV